MRYSIETNAGVTSVRVTLASGETYEQPVDGRTIDQIQRAVRAAEIRDLEALMTPDYSWMEETAAQKMSAGGFHIEQQ